MALGAEPRSEFDSLAYAALLGSACGMAFSLPLGRGLLALSFALLLIALVAERRRFAFDGTACFGLLFIVVAICATFFGLNPERGVPKLWKLAWFIGIPVYASQVRNHRRLDQVLTAFALGAGVQALVTCVSNTTRAIVAVRQGAQVSLTRALIDAGSMTDGQIMMLGLLVTIGLLMGRRHARRPCGWYWALMGLQIVGLIVNFKRGSWICTVGVIALFLALRANWKYTLALVAVVAVSLSIPAVRTRLADLDSEMHARRGGRMLMWKTIAPELVRRHPWGIGYRALTNDMMREIAPRVERERDHLHSNIAQILVATGWLGFGLYVLWMGKAALDGVGVAWRGRSGSAAERTNTLVLLLMFLALLGNGLVEYNFGDAEIVLAYTLAMGSIAGLRDREPEGSQMSIARLAFPS